MIKRRMFGAFSCVVLGYAAFASGQQPAKPADETEQTKVTTSEATIPAPPSSRAAESLLRKRVDAVNWTDKPFEEVLDWLRDIGEGRVNIVPKWKPLNAEGVTPESPLVTLKLNNTTVAEVLNETLDQLSEDGEIRYRGIDNKLTISTRADFERKHYLRVYNITNLIFRVPDFGQGAPAIDLNKTKGSGGGGGGGGGGGQSVFGGGSGGGQAGGQNIETEQTIKQRLVEIKQLIERTIAPETWDLTGPGSASQAAGAGGRGRIEVYERSLVISNTIEVHEEIAGMFSLD